MVFDHQHIQNLLDNYFEGQTSIADEQQLQQFFQQKNIPEPFQPYAGWFQFVTAEQAQSIGPDFLPQLRQQIAVEEIPRAATKVLRLPPVIQRIAAITIGIGLITWLWSSKVHKPPTAKAIDWSQYEPETPAEAMAIYQKTMMKVSVHLNQGVTKASSKLQKIEDLGAYFK